MEKNTFGNLYEGTKKVIKKAPSMVTKGVGLLTLTTMLIPKTTEGQVITTGEGHTINPDKCYIRPMDNNGNMPDGISRSLYGEDVDKHDNKSHFNSHGSIFFLDDSTKATIVTAQGNPSTYSKKINFKEINTVARDRDVEGALFFSGAYTDSLGNIEGNAYEKGVLVGNTEHAPYAGVVYITPTGKIELINCRDTDGVFDEAKLEGIKDRAASEGGSFYQQKAAIWNGEVKLVPKSLEKREWRAICQTEDGKKFVIHCNEKITLAEFLKLATSMKDDQGNELVYDLLLEDTGSLSLGQFRTNQQIADDLAKNTFTSYPMIDENFQNKSGYTNTLVIGTHREPSNVSIGTVTTRDSIQQVKPIDSIPSIKPSEPSERPYVAPTEPSSRQKAPTQSDDNIPYTRPKR